MAMPYAWSTGQTASGVLDKSIFDAYTILMATTDDTPIALTITEQTLIGRKTSGIIAALSGADALLAMGITPLVAELNYVDGVTSAIQTQLGLLAPLSVYFHHGNIDGGDLNGCYPAMDALDVNLNGGTF